MALSKIQTTEMLDAPNLGRRNIIINGAMQVSQRGTDINDIANDSTYIMDRFLTRNYGGNGTYDYDYSTDVPTATFKNSLKLTCKSASTNTGTAGYAIEQRIEGYNIRQLRLGRSNAQPITVSFWVKSSVAGTYSTGLRTTSAEYSYVTEFALSANTWKYVTYTAPALTNSLSSLNEESGGSGLLVDLVGLGKQTNKETSTLNAWQSGNKVNSSNQVAWMDSVNATVHLTGVQLEVGEIATPFEHRPFGEELALCQRYYWQNEDVFVYGKSREADRHRDCTISNPVEMRATPTVTKLTDPSGFTASWVAGGKQSIRMSGMAPSDGYVATCGTAKAEAEL
ncbi:hypothetical protein MelnitzEXVC044M_177 [Methylophilales phage Melnitz EXVC044M]|nr:hypothetical protein Melnitz1EXVC043M_176 [Methylophilales phage Melnitz-1 EXVC043M]QZI94681.1 hypothetical protein Melnitz2EXVC040M_177 [Methylophilales phage Melnitz-2 EXVC040M]QZI94903.1 hypothetical protein MelnitzEXVC044M_177 [Methylophilales phage Melnitz EXVC044M]